MVKFAWGILYLLYEKNKSWGFGGSPVFLAYETSLVNIFAYDSSNKKKYFVYEISQIFRQLAAIYICYFFYTHIKNPLIFSDVILYLLYN